MTFLPYHAIDPYIRAFVSHYDILTIGIISTSGVSSAHPTAGALSTARLHACLGKLPPTSAGSVRFDFCKSCRTPQYQGRRFRALPRHSTCRNISSSSQYSSFFQSCSIGLARNLFSYERVARTLVPAPILAVLPISTRT